MRVHRLLAALAALAAQPAAASYDLVVSAAPTSAAAGTQFDIGFALTAGPDAPGVIYIDPPFEYQFDPSRLSGVVLAGAEGDLECEADLAKGLLRVGDRPPIIPKRGAAPTKASDGHACVFRFTVRGDATPGVVEIEPIGGGVCRDQQSQTLFCETNGVAVEIRGGVPPTLNYNPTAGTTITFPGGVAGSKPRRVIEISASGGNGGTRLFGPCTVPSGFATVGGLPFVFGANSTEPKILGIDCTLGDTARSGNLVCTESGDTETAPPRQRSWPLSCPAATRGAPLVSVTADPARRATAGVVTLRWNARDATACTPSGGPAGTVFPPGPFGASAQVAVNVTPPTPGIVTVFTVNCSGPAGNGTGRVAVALGQPAPPPRTPVANASGAGANGPSGEVALSDGGRFVVFSSDATNLVPGDSNGRLDVFRRDTLTGALVRISQTAAGAPLDRISAQPDISRDGNVVAYTRGTQRVSAADSAKVELGGGQVCVQEVIGNKGSCISNAPNGTPGNGSSGDPSVSGDGRFVLFESTATNIGDKPDANGAQSDVFAYDKSDGSVKLLSANAQDQQSNGDSRDAHVSCNGRFHAMASTASNLGGTVAGGMRNIYVGSVGGKGVTLITRGTGGAAANGNSGSPHVSDDGRSVVFASAASNLVPGDTNGVSDVFLATLNGPAVSIRRLSVGPGGVQGNGSSRDPEMACDGAWVSFSSEASNLVAGDGNGRSDAFVAEIASNTVALVSQPAAGDAANGASSGAALAPDGSTVGFESSAANLGAAGGGSAYSATNPFQQQNYTGGWFDPAQNGHGLFLQNLADGRLIAYWFTFDPQGRQAWFGGDGQLVGNRATVVVFRVSGPGARFGSAFDAANLDAVPFGTLQFQFSDCANGRVDFALGQDFGTGSMTLRRLTVPVGARCGAAGVAAAQAEPDDAWTKALALAAGVVTGSWFDPSRAGEGLFLQNLAPDRLVAYWFTFQPAGGDAWFGGVGQIVGNRVLIDVVRTQGGRWIPNFNPAAITNPVLGRLEFTFTDCNRASVSYTLGSGFGTGTLPLAHLTAPPGVSCDAPP